MTEIKVQVDKDTLTKLAAILVLFGIGSDEGVRRSIDAYFREIFTLPNDENQR